MIVRPAEPDDVPAVAELERVALAGDAWSPGLVEEGIRGRLPTVAYLVAVDPGEVVVGHAVVSWAGEIAELQRIGVLPELRRRGVARALLAAVLDLAAGTEADRLLLEVRATNLAALAFYADSGFEEIDRRPRYYSDGAEAVVMLKSLNRLR